MQKLENKFTGIESINVVRCGLFEDLLKTMTPKQLAELIINNTAKAVDVKDMAGNIIGLAHTFRVSEEDQGSILFDFTGNDNWNKKVEKDCMYMIPSKMGISLGEAEYGKGQWPCISEKTATWVDWLPDKGGAW